MSKDVIVEIIKGISSIIVAAITFEGAYLGSKLLKNKKNCKIKLSSHPVFSRVELNKNIILTYFNLSNKGKELIFKEILSNHMDIYKKYISILCENIENKDIDSNELYTLSVNTINNIINDLRTFYKKDNRYNEEEEAVLNIVIGKYNNWDSERELEIIDRLQEICGSAFYPDNYTKAVTILDTFLFAINSTISDANKTLNSINGDLKGLVFKGVTI